MFLMQQRRSAAERHTKFGSMSLALLAQLESYLPSLDTMKTALGYSNASSTFIHGDIHEENLLGVWCDHNGIELDNDDERERKQQQRASVANEQSPATKRRRIYVNDDNDAAELWQPRALIDFGDIRRGNWMHELVAVHLSIFRGDVALLKQFLPLYGISLQCLPANFSYQAMCYTLLQVEDSMKMAYHFRPDLYRAQTLNEIEQMLWSLQ
jgi:hypothetical protein